MSKAATALLLLTFAAALAAADLIKHDVPRDQLKRRTPVDVPAADAPPPFDPTFDAEQQEYLKAHNDFRQKVGSPPLEWAADLTAAAHSWAVNRSVDCKFRQHSTNQYGENIYWNEYMEFTPTDAVQFWFNETRFYNHEKHVCNCQPEVEGCECGHYLAVIWATTKRVGCSGAVYCDDQAGVIVVCNYDPAGSLQPGVDPLKPTD